MDDKRQSNSLRARLDVVILAIALFVTALVFFSGQNYLRLAIDAQRAELVDTLRLSTKKLIRDLSQSSNDLARLIQQDQRLLRAFYAVDAGELASLLAEQFRDNAGTLKQLKLEELQIVDRSFIMLARATATGRVDGVSVATCPGLSVKASKSMAQEPAIFLCNSSGKPVIGSISPIGHRPDGYIIVISDLAYGVVSLEVSLGMPLSIALQDGTSIYESAAISETRQTEFPVIATYSIEDGNGQILLSVSAHPYLTPFVAKLKAMRNFIMLMMGLLLVAAMFYLRKMVADVVINPIQSLSRQLRSSSYTDFVLENTESADSSTESEEPWELQELYGALHDMAVTDALTGLANRAQFERQLKHLVGRVRPDGAGHVLCYLDIDQFKVVNETCGHIGGDEFLRIVAELIQGKIHDTDLVARLGGDEFGIVFKDCSLTKAIEISNKLLESIKEHKFVWEEERFHMGASIGVVMINEDNCDLKTVLSCADSACYAAKEAGRNRIQIFQQKDEVLARRHGEIQWVARINNAIEEDLFQVLYQPVVPIVPKKDVKLGCELLLRMVDDNGELISPAAFMPAAERYGLMPSLDRWVIRSVFKWLDSTPDALKHFDVFFVNISSQSLGDENFLGYVREQLMQVYFSPKQICFEVTETAAITDAGRVMKFAGQIREMGFRIALDHFGSGVSSFRYLKTLPVDYLKIDGSFVKDMINNPIDRAIVRSVLDVGKAMGVETIAEHVENHDILIALQEIGVDFAQGYGILPPRRLSELSKELSGDDSLVIGPENFSASRG